MSVNVKDIIVTYCENSDQRKKQITFRVEKVLPAGRLKSC